METGINLLRAAIIRPHKNAYYGWLALLIGAVLAYFFIPGFFFFILAAGAVVLVARGLEWGLYALALTSFLTNWEITIVLRPLRDAFNVPLPAAVTAPIGDLVAIGVGVAFLLALALGWCRLRPAAWRTLWPRLAWYVVFLFVATVAAFSVYDHAVASSVKYLLRPLLFSVAAFVIMPFISITTSRVLYRLLGVWLLVGVAVALYGVASFFVLPSDGWPRATPWPIFGVQPLGSNHNLLAEPLVALVPIALFFWVSAKQGARTATMLLRGVTILLAAITLLTLSRAAWLALAMEAAILLYYNRGLAERWWRAIWPRYAGLFLAAVIVLGYMGWFLSSPVVASSDQSRTTMFDIVRFYAPRSPWIGFGPGSFIRLIADTAVFRIEYGDPLDSHGFLQKVFIEEGILGLAAFVVFLVQLLGYLARRRGSNPTANGLAVCLYMMVAGAVTFQVFNTSYFTSTMWLPIGVALTGMRLIEEGKIEKQILL